MIGLLAESLAPGLNVQIEILAQMNEIENTGSRASGYMCAQACSHAHLYLNILHIYNTQILWVLSHICAATFKCL